MAISLTPNLKLRVSSDLTADAKYNLARIDSLTGLVQVAIKITSTDVTQLRSKSSIALLPESPDLGGSGSGGSVSMGSSSQPLDTFTVHATSVVLPAGAIDGAGIDPDFGNQIIQTSNSLRFTNGSNYTALKQATSGQSQNITLFLPPSAGTVGQVLTTDGSGVLSWSNSTSASLSGLTDTDIGVPADGDGLVFSVGGGSQWINKKSSFSTTWAPADGLVKTVTHSLNTQKVLVQVIDDTYKNVGVETVDRPDANNVQLTSSTIPSGPWTILIHSVN